MHFCKKYIWVSIYFTTWLKYGLLPEKKAKQQFVIVVFDLEESCVWLSDCPVAQGSWWATQKDIRPQKQRSSSTNELKLEGNTALLSHRRTLKTQPALYLKQTYKTPFLSCVWQGFLSSSTKFLQNKKESKVNRVTHEDQWRFSSVGIFAVLEFAIFYQYHHRHKFK